MIVVRKTQNGWIIFGHPQYKHPRHYHTGFDALRELYRLSELWPRCASYDDFIHNIPD